MTDTVREHRTGLLDGRNEITFRVGGGKRATDKQLDVFNRINATFTETPFGLFFQSKGTAKVEPGRIISKIVQSFFASKLFASYKENPNIPNKFLTVSGLFDRY